MGGEAKKERQPRQGWTAILVTIRRLQIVCLEEGKVAQYMLITLLSGLQVCTGGGQGVFLDFREPRGGK